MGETPREKSRQEMSDEINKMIAEIAQYKTQIEIFKQERNDAIQSSQAEIKEIKEEHERALKQIERDQARIANLICEIDCKRSEIMPDEPIKAADCLIHARGIRETSKFERTFRKAERYESYDLYSVSDLREIAAHLLAYCDNNEQEVGADV